MFLLSVQYISRQGDKMTYMNNMKYTYGTMNDMNPLYDIFHTHE